MKYSVSAESVLHNSQVKIQKYYFDQIRKAKIIKLPVFFHLKKNQLMIFLCKSPDLLQGLKVFTLVYEFYKLFVGGCICVLLTCVL